MDLLMGGSKRKNVWTPRGYALEASAAADELAVQEPSVIYSAGTWRMWYSQGVADRNIAYATSTDGINFTRYGGNPVLDEYTRAYVFDNAGTYTLYAINVGASPGYHKLTSADGITWADQGSVVMTGAAQPFESSGMANICVWVEGAVWHMMYEASNGTTYQIGHASGADGITFARDAGNPVLPNAAGMIGGPFVQKIGAAYYCWVHKSTSGLVLPTDVARYKSSNLTNWTADPSMLTIPRLDTDDGVGTAAGQTADCHLCEVNGTTYAYITDCYNGGIPTAGIRVLTAPMSIAALTRSNEGISGSFKRTWIFNGGFERTAAGAPDTFEKWILSPSDGAIARAGGAGEYRAGSSGLYAVRLTAGSAKNTAISQSITNGAYPASTAMLITGWARGDGTNRGRIRLFGSADIISDWSSTPYLSASTTWTEFSIPLITPASGNITLYFYCPDATGGVAYLDDLKFTKA